ncbi:hypothetical protein PIB30_071927 [Stylosanthes scabra]|uniref:Uncharacterized protein n=1 Tax=Stylosanthes scabra TaxID=79078 RepID=A0ABU6WPP3_9FABA|nr:hypothetical protein [Stylosanthes scabra]
MASTISFKSICRTTIAISIISHTFSMCHHPPQPPTSQPIKDAASPDLPPSDLKLSSSPSSTTTMAAIVIIGAGGGAVMSPLLPIGCNELFPPQSQHNETVNTVDI